MADPEKHPVAPGWRKAPPTAAEVEAWQWWWVRSESSRKIMRLFADAKPLRPGAERAIRIAYSDGLVLKPEICGGEWAPCLPPPDEVSRG